MHPLYPLKPFIGIQGANRNSCNRGGGGSLGWCSVIQCIWLKNKTHRLYKPKTDFPKNRRDLYPLGHLLNPLLGIPISIWNASLVL